MSDPNPLWRVADDGRPFDLLGLGQISLDRVGRIDRMPEPGRKGTLHSEHARPGGQVATALLAARRLGLRCALAGCVGDDAEALHALAPLERAGVDLTSVARLAAFPTRQAWVLVEQGSGERTVLEQRDPALRADPEQVPDAAIARARVLLIDLEHPEASREAAARARSAGIPVLLDADRATEDACRLAREVDFPIVSRTFAEEFSSEASLEDTLRALSGPGTRMAIVTRGARGSLALRDGRLIETPALRVPVVDTTGAGDVFRAGFAWGLVRGFAAKRVLRAANAAAALGCRGEGAQGALPDRAEVEASLEGGA